jgi:hypothetical protein
MWQPGQAVRDGAREGVVVDTKYNRVTVWFKGDGAVDYLRKTGKNELATAAKTVDDLQPASSMQLAATLLLQLFLSGRPFSVQEGKLTVLEDTGAATMPAENAKELIDALEIFLR